MTGDELYQGILAEPDSDLRRLVYADWLDESGDHPRAEFIRLQCRIAELRRSCLCRSCVQERGGGQRTNGPCAVDKARVTLLDGRTEQAHLRLREAGLLHAHGTRWLQGLSGLPPIIRWLRVPEPLLVQAGLR